MVGSVASVLLTLALVSAAWAERKSIPQPLNATSHWLHGNPAAEIQAFDLAHTGVGYATHHVATIFWAALFDLRSNRRDETPATLVRDSVAMAAIAAGVDYLATPKHLTPGWELVLTKRSMAWTYLALAAGFAIGSAAVERRTA